MSATINLQATIGGMSGAGGSAVTVMGALDVPTGMLLVDSSRPVPAGSAEVRYGDCAAVTNNPQAEVFDALFTEKDLRGAIGDYFAFAGRGLLVMEDAQRFLDPSTKVLQDGVDEAGVKYRFHPDITNGQVAVIVLCWFALRQAGFARQIEAFDTSVDTNITTVGIPGLMRGSSASGQKVVRYEMGGELPIGVDGWPV